MMKHLKLFNAKLALLEGKEPQGLTEEELKTVKSSEVSVLYDNARRGCYNYGCLKTKNGTSSIWHDAGTDRFDASMKTLSQLGELGKKLHLTSPASALRDDVQLQLLQNRKDKNWMKENIEDLAAKTIVAQVLTNRGTPDWQQRSQLEGEALKAKVNSIRVSDAFKQMMKTVGSDGVADAMIKGGTRLAEAYQKSVNALKAAEKGQNAAGIDANDLAPKKDDPGLSSPVR